MESGNRHPLIIYGIVIVAALIASISALEIIAIGPVMTAISRWIAILGIGYLVWKRNNLTTWILFSMVIGAEFGYDFPAVATELSVVSKIFLKLIKTIIAPLIFGTLVVGIAGHPNLKQVGRMGWKSILYFEVATTIALFIGLLAINISKAGVGIVMPPHDEAKTLDIPLPTGWQETILHIFPENIAKSIADGQVLQIVVFSIFFALGLAMVKEPHKQTMLKFCESLTEVMFKFTGVVMYFAPFAVGCAIAYTVGHMGFGILGNLFQLLATLYAALFAFIILVFLPVALVIKLPLKKFFNAVIEPATIAFSTTSSEAALPKALENMERFGIPRKVVAFVLPAGYSFNLDGSTLYLSLATIFVAQAAGIHLPIAQQIIIVLTLMLTTKGIAGVPRASLVILMATATSFGLPIEPIFLILGIDALMDMGRTSVNLIGNCLASAVIAKWEGEETYNDPANREFL
ncbi:MAG: dicarboxylate/amino acid:cation symporter [Saprospiraceae bacterium]